MVRSEILADFVCAECADAARALDLEVVERVYVDDFQLSCLNLLKIWVEWRMSHDLKSAKIICCERSQGLFNALEEFEKTVTARGGVH